LGHKSSKGVLKRGRTKLSRSDDGFKIKFSCVIVGRWVSRRWTSWSGSRGRSLKENWQPRV